MLNDNNNIDQLFRKALGDYEKTPPGSVWINIEASLNRYKWNRRVKMFKEVGIAAAVILAIIAGWWMINPVSKDLIRQNSKTVGVILKKNTVPSESTKIPQAPNGNINQVDSILPKINSATRLNGTSLATFAANTSFINKESRLSSQKSSDQELFSTEKDLSDKLGQNFKMAQKITDWLTSPKRDDSISATKNDQKYVSKVPIGQSTSDKFISIATMNPAKNMNRRWSIKAEFAPVFDSHSQNSGQRTNFLSNNSPFLPSQKTISENTFSAGIVAGYKIVKRLGIKSGMVYNKIGQTTKHVNIVSVNPFFNIPGNVMFAATPAGQVTLNNRGNTRFGDILSSNTQPDNSVIYSGENVLKQDIQFVEIPVQATYKLIDNKLGIGLTGGISTNILVGNKAVLSANGDRISNGETSNLRSVVYSGEVGFEIGYEITNRITLTVEPRLKHFISSLSTIKSVDYKPNQVEIVTGLTYWFN